MDLVNNRGRGRGRGRGGGARGGRTRGGGVGRGGGRGGGRGDGGGGGGEGGGGDENVTLEGAAFDDAYDRLQVNDDGVIIDDDVENDDILHALS